MNGVKQKSDKLTAGDVLKNALRNRCWHKYAIALVTPFILMLLLLAVCRGNLFNFTPVWSDELGYWHETDTAVNLGLFSENSGYFSYLEIPSKLLFYGAHGIFVIIPYYLIGIIFGWTAYSPLIANIIFMTVAMLLFARITRETRHTIILAVLLLFFNYFLLYYITAMSETLHYAISIVIIALVSRCFTDTALKKRYMILLFIAVTIASLIRISNVVFYLPMMLMVKLTKKRHYLYLILGWPILTALLFYICSRFSAPYPFGFLSGLLGAAGSGDLYGALNMLWDHFVTNIKLFLSPKDNVLLVFGRYASILVLILSGFFSFFTVKHGRVVRRENADRVCLSSFLILFFTVMINLLLYDIFDWRDTRAIAPVLFVTILLLATHAGAHTALKASVVTLAVISMIGFSHIFVNAENRFNGNDPSNYSLIHAVKYDPDASSRWENTILINGFPPGSVNLDPGLAYSFSTFSDDESFNNTTQGGIKSRYVISYGALSDERLELMAEENGCFLYLNLTLENEK